MAKELIHNLLGVMQGRLLPKYEKNYQAHPIGYWKDEFPIAADIGLDCIEFIFDYNHFEKNPLMTLEGHQQIQSICEKTGVHVSSICADYFMTAPLHSVVEKTTSKSTAVLIDLLKAAEKLQIRDIVIPCVDQSSIQTEHSRDRFKEVILSIVPEAEKYQINLSLETDLNPFQFEKLLSDLNSPCVRVNYDIGNSAALGYDYKDELNAYAERISDIHIKDRELGGSSVTLGFGNADIPGFFKYLDKFNYQGPFIMQAYRDDEGIAIFKKQLKWVKPFLSSSGVSKSI